MPPVVELYTSEGCNSCPPADRWLSKLKADPSVVALAFHVDYWDRLGWKDRFASAAFTARQAEQQASNGARFSYTPQVVVDGRIARTGRASRVPLGDTPAAPVDVAAGARRRPRHRDRRRRRAAAPKRLAAYWAVTEQGHVTAVKAGENRGRDAAATTSSCATTDRCRPGRARAGAPQTLAFTAAGAAPTRRRIRASVNLVVVDADSGRPVQALKIAC